ncbi:MAG: DUF3786 domain-containing protein [Desulfobacterales bacterium]|jgi:hypothetical protein|nr:DUF3786 domain-containing protein [Desulfobacterales bacterium]
MRPRNPIIEQTCQRYRAEIADIDLREIEARLGICFREDGAVIPLLGTDYLVSREALTDPAGQPAPAAVCVILCRHLLLCPASVPPDVEWVSFRDFRDAAPLIASFANTVEGAIARGFAGRTAELRQAAEALGGRPPAEPYRYDVSLVIPALPRVPLLLLFNDADEGFPAACSVLFERRAEGYLDMECLAMVGMLLADRLKKPSH